MRQLPCKSCYAAIPVIAICGALVLSVLLVAPRSCEAGIIVGGTATDARTRQITTTGSPITSKIPTVIGGSAANAKSISKPSSRPVASPRMNADLAGIGPLDLTRRNPSPSVFTGPEFGSSSNGILGLCLEMTRRPQNGDPIPPLNPLLRDLLSPLPGSSSGIVATCSMSIDDPWNISTGTMSGSPGSLANWQGIDAFQLALLNVEPGGNMAAAALPLGNFGNMYVPAILAAVGSGSIHSTDDSSDGPKHYVSSEAIARGVGSTSSGVASSSAGDHPPLESAGNLLWFLAAALGAYPLLRGKAAH
jgi:hypothetical protein